MKQKYPTSKYIAIRLYAHSSIGQPFNSQYQGKLIPLIFGNVALIQEKFSSVPMNEIVLNNIRAGEQRRIGDLPNGMIQRHINSTSMTRYFRQFTFQESPWLECTTIKK